MSNGQEHNPHRRSGFLMLAVGWLLAFAGVYWYFDGWTERQENPNSEQVLAGQAGEVVLVRNRMGHYVADGQINGRKVTFLLDTGATQVALPLSLARELKLPLKGTIMLQTANGTAIGYSTQLEKVRIGPIEERNVSAIASEGIEGEVVLLGMSFLRRVEFVQRGDRLTLRQLPAGR